MRGLKLKEDKLLVWHRSLRNSAGIRVRQVDTQGAKCKEVLTIRFL